jgi:electron transport complex protein RnfG
MADKSSTGLRVVHFGLVLLIVCIAASLSLGMIFKVAQPNIKKNEEKRITEGLEELYSDTEGVKFEKKETEVNEKTITYWEARKDGSLLGYVVPGSAKGYSSEIQILVRADVKVTAVEAIKVTESQETPGLGERIKEIKSNKTIIKMIMGETEDESGLKPWFQEKFKGLSVTNIVLVKSAEEEKAKKGVVAITGATISSTGVVNAVNNGVANLKTILSKGAAE